MPTREHIVEQSLELFVRYGLKRVRMDDIAAQLGVSKRTLYELFDNREGLIGECIQLNMIRHKQAHHRRERENLNIIEQFLAMVDNWESMMHDDVNFMIEVQRYYPKLHEQITAEHYREGVEQLKEELRRGEREGLLLPGINIEFAAQVLCEAIRNIFMNPNAYDNSNLSMMEAFKYITLYFFRGISTNKGRRQLDRVTAKLIAEGKARHNENRNQPTRK